VQLPGDEAWSFLAWEMHFHVATSSFDEVGASHAPSYAFLVRLSSIADYRVTFEKPLFPTSIRPRELVDCAFALDNAVRVGLLAPESNILARLVEKSDHQLKVVRTTGNL